MSKRWRGWGRTRPPDNPDHHNIGYIYFVLNAATKRVIHKVANNVNMAHFKPFIQRAEAAWNEINSLPIASLSYSANFIDKYRSLLYDAEDAVDLGDTDVAFALTQKMDDLLSQLKRPGRTTASERYNVDESSQHGPANPSLGNSNSMFTGANGVYIYGGTFNVTPAQPDTAVRANIVSGLA